MSRAGTRIASRHRIQAVDARQGSEPFMPSAQRIFRRNEMEDMNRRQALGALAATSAGMVIANLTGVAQMDAHAQTSAGAAPAFRGQNQPKPLPFDPAKLNGLSEKLIRSHWENNYQGAVRALNA